MGSALTSPLTQRGPKARAEVTPLDLSKLPKAGPRRVEAFCKQFLVIPKGTGARKPFKLHPFQVEIVKGIFPHPNTGKRPRQGLVVLPRANGKSALAAALAIYCLFADEEDSPQVLIVASDMRQGHIIFNMARRMIELSPELSKRCQIYTGSDNSKIVVPGNDGLLTVLPSNPDALQGWDPSAAFVDELHVVDEETWQAVALAAGKRERSLCLAISTPSDSADSIMYKLVEHGRKGTDSSFYFREYAALNQEHPTSCRECWASANPAIAAGFLHVDAIEALHATTREGAFRRFRLGQWLSHQDAWLPLGLFEERADATRVVPDKTKVCLGFDGSASGDSTALIGCTVDGPHLFVLGIWANPGDPRWRVPRLDVDKTVKAAFDRYDVVELACDPWGWRSEIQGWSEAWPGRVAEWPTSTLHRMGPATDAAYQAIVKGEVTHDGNADLVTHFGNAVAKVTPHGDVITKAARSSPRKIDAAVAAIVAHSRAMHHSRKKTSRKVMSW